MRKKSENNNVDRTKKITKQVSLLTLALFVVGIMTIFAFQLFNEEDEYGKEYENYISYLNSKEDFEFSKENPYNHLYFLDQYKQSGDLKDLKKALLETNNTFYSNLIKFLKVEYYIEKSEFQKADEILDKISKRSFLSLKYHYKGLVYYFQDDFERAREYYMFSLEFSNEEIVSEMTTLAIKSLPDSSLERPIGEKQ